MYRSVAACLIGCSLLASPLLEAGEIRSAGAPRHDRQVAAAAVTVIDETAGSMTVELTVPELATAYPNQGGQGCGLLTAPGLTPVTERGRPTVPTRGVFLAVPSLADLRLEVVESAAQPLAARPLCVAEPPEAMPPIGPTETTASLADAGGVSLPSHVSPESASPPLADDVYPGILAEVRTSGILRGQPVAQVQFYPLQVDGAGRLLFFSRLRVRISYHALASAGRPAHTASGPFEQLLRGVLLNQPLPALAGGPAETSGATPAPVLALTSTPSPPAAKAPALKVFVDHAGVTRLVPADLAAAGWDVAALDPTMVRLIHQGQEVPLWIEDHGDGFAGNDDFMLFYAEPMTGPYSRRNVYWLSAGEGPGLRMATRDVTPSHSYPIASDFPSTLHVEKDSGLAGYWQNPPGKERQDHWYWTGRLTAPTSAEMPFWMPAFAPVPDGVRLRVRLAGRTNDSAVSPDHHTRILLNGVPVGEARWDGQQEFTHEIILPAGLLVPGDNTLDVSAVGDTGAAVDQIYGNWIEIEHRARYVSHDDQLAFGAPGEGQYQFRVSGFTGDAFQAFDITDPSAPVRLTGAQSAKEVDGNTAIFEDDTRASARYLVLLPTQERPPDSLAADRPSDLRNPANEADEIIITYDDFYDEVLRLAAHRQAQGLRVAVVRVTDVFDEFSGGISTPEALHGFLSYAYRYWSPPAPAYVLLVGDAHLDYLNRFGTGSINYVPTYIFDASGVGETAYDDWFACVDGDDPFPDVFLGRLSARSSEDVRAMVDKIIAYESQAPNEPWARRALFVADDDRPTFEASAERWIKQLPLASTPLRVYTSRYPPGDPQSDIVASINAGAFLVSYVGHGNQDRWGSWQGETFFDTSTISSLNNAGRLPFVVTATCLDGFFVNPFMDYCLAEQFARKPDGGAVAVWAPTALGFAEEHELLFARLFEHLFATSRPTVGRVVAQAKLAAYSDGVSAESLETFALFSDPALQLWILANERLFLPLVLDGAAKP